MCGRGLFSAFLSCALSASLSGQAIPPADTSATPPSSSLSASTPSTGSAPMQNWDSLDELLRELEAEANAQAEDLKKLLGQLEESQTDLNELSILLGQSAMQLRSLEEALMNEREQARQTIQIAIDRGARAEKSRDRWRLGAFVAGGFGIAGWLAFALSSWLGG